MIRLFINTKLKKQPTFYKQILNYFKLNNSSKLINELMLLGFDYVTKYPLTLGINELQINTGIDINQLKFSIKNLNLHLNTLLNIQIKFLITLKNLHLFTSALLFYEHTGARSTWEQLQQIISVRGYISDCCDLSIPLPILNGFNSGLNLYEFILSCYGARKGILDSSIKTADAGYLTRRLVEGIQNITIKEYNCMSTNAYIMPPNLNSIGFKSLFYLKLGLGKILLKDIKNKRTGQLLYKKNTVITTKLIKILENFNINNFVIRATNQCLCSNSICHFCAGNFNKNEYTKINSIPLGILAAQSISEPATQITLRTFHLGGVFKNSISKSFFYKNKINLKHKFKFCLLPTYYNTYNYKKIFNNLLNIYFKQKLLKKNFSSPLINLIPYTIKNNLNLNYLTYYNFLYNNKYRQPKFKPFEVFIKNIYFLTNTQHYNTWQLIATRMYNKITTFNYIIQNKKKGITIKSYSLTCTLNNTLKLAIYKTNYLEYINMIYIKNKPIKLNISFNSAEITNNIQLTSFGNVNKSSIIQSIFYN